MTKLLAVFFALIVLREAWSRHPYLSARWFRPIVEHFEEGLARRWPDPGRVRVASGLFFTTLALLLAGVVGAVGVASPAPVVHLSRLVDSAVTAATPGVEAAASADVADEPSLPATGADVPATGADAPATGADVPAPGADAPATGADVPATGVAAPTSSPPDDGAPAPPAKGGALPIGKGMWIWLPDRADGGDPEAIVRRAAEVGLTHLYVRTGTLKEGFMGGPFLDRLLPAAHANNLRVFGWDFPYLDHPGQDVIRALAAIRYTTPDGHRIDGFSADIESTNEGTNNDLQYVTAYVTWLRQNVGPNYPLIATVPNPTPQKLAAGFPYAEVVAPFDAVAPMVYWMNRDPANDAAKAIRYLSQFGKPVFPIGQAYDGGPEGGPAGAPGRDQLISFMQSAEQHGAAGVSFWSWQHATQEAWDAVRDAGEFRLHLGGPNGEGLTAGMVRAYQTALTGLGFPVLADGSWGKATIEALLKYQKAARLKPSGLIDAATQRFLLAPVPAPVRPE